MAHRSPPALRRRPSERLAAWLYTGPLGHLYGSVADVVTIWFRFTAARLRGRPPT